MSTFDKDKIKQAVGMSAKGMLNMLPILLGVVMLVSIFTILVPKEFYKTLFSGNLLGDMFTGSVLGSVLSGNPVTAYILGNGFLKNGVSLVAVTAFIATWTTVGLVQLPAETLILGKRFGIYRNLSAFFMSIPVAAATVLILNLL